jgi:hypothetical protein
MKAELLTSLAVGCAALCAAFAGESVSGENVKTTFANAPAALPARLPSEVLYPRDSGLTNHGAFRKRDNVDRAKAKGKDESHVEAMFLSGRLDLAGGLYGVGGGGRELVSV